MEVVGPRVQVPGFRSHIGTQGKSATESTASMSGICPGNACSTSMMPTSISGTRALPAAVHPLSLRGVEVGRSLCTTADPLWKINLAMAEGLRM